MRYPHSDARTITSGTGSFWHQTSFIAFSRSQSRFMICCDTCEDWYHGDCVGVTQTDGKELEKRREEWMCPKCKSKHSVSFPSSKSDDIVYGKFSLKTLYFLPLQIRFVLYSFSCRSFPHCTRSASVSSLTPYESK